MIFEIKNKKKNLEWRFLRECLIYRLEILTSYCINWRLYVVKTSRDYLPLFFRRKLFLKKFSFWLSHDNKSKNYPIVLKFGTDVASDLFRSSLLPKKIGQLRKNKIIMNSNNKTFFFFIKTKILISIAKCHCLMLKWCVLYT